MGLDQSSMTYKNRKPVDLKLKLVSPDPDLIMKAARELADSWLEHWATPRCSRYTVEKYVNARTQIARLFYPAFVDSNLSFLAADIRMNGIARNLDVSFPEGAD